VRPESPEPTEAADLPAARRTFGRLVAGHLAVTWLAALVVVVSGMAKRALPLDNVANASIFVALMSAAVAGWWILTRHGKSRAAGLVLCAVLALDLFSVGLHTANFVPDVPENLPQTPRAKRLIEPADVQWRVDGAAGLNGYGTYFHIADVYPSSASILELQSIHDLRSLPVDRFWDVLAVRYVTLPDTVAPPPSVPVNLLATQTNQLGQFYQLYELKDPRPLAWLTYAARPAASHAEALGLLADPSINLREVAITDGPAPIELPGQRPPESDVVDARMTGPDRVDIRVYTSKPALLLVAVPDYPGWRATVNGQPTPITDVDGGLIGIPITSGGRPQIVLEFAPALQTIAAAISVIALLAAAGLSVWEWRRR
jgi:hypothetical protein